MSRIGKKPIPIPDKVEVSLQGQHVTMKGPKGTLSATVSDQLKIAYADQQITLTRIKDEDRSIHGLSRTLVSNLVVGVTDGYEKKLEIRGVGYKAQMKGKILTLTMGYTHPVEITPPEDVTIKVEENIITVSGPNKLRVGEIAATIRRVRVPEPYKGKGIRYAGEFVPHKEGKRAATATG